ncbi:MAG: hypothetical protein S4CHLAM37_01120 [Chlamydiia bacterium]|nr:hypothetical protein [Chlamydiia bacterium]
MASRSSPYSTVAQCFLERGFDNLERYCNRQIEVEFRHVNEEKAPPETLRTGVGMFFLHEVIKEVFHNAQKPKITCDTYRDEKGLPHTDVHIVIHLSKKSHTKKTTTTYKTKIAFLNKSQLGPFSHASVEEFVSKKVEVIQS